MVGALLTNFGCRPAQTAQERIALRGQRVARTVELALESERSRPPRRARTLNEVRRSLHRHAQATRANTHEIELYWDRQWKRWIDRQSVYRAEAGRILRGAPDRIKHHAIIMFF
jgi:hypothetical protein